MKPYTSIEKDIRLALLAAGELAQQEVDVDLQPWLRNYFRNHFERLLRDTELCFSLTGANSKLLDLGSAPFFTTMALQSLGCDVVGVDLAPERFERLLETADLRVKRCNLEAEPLPFENDTFDLILFSEVLEHLRIDLIGTVAEIHRVLRPAGYLLCSTPNLFEFRKILRLLIKRRTSNIYSEYNKLRTLGHMGHVTEYTAPDVIDFMTRMGFRCEKTIYRGLAEWRFRPASIAQAISHRLFPSTRNWFMLLLIKEQSRKG